MTRAQQKNTPIRTMLVSPRQFCLFVFGHDGLAQIEGARQRLGNADLFADMPILTLNEMRRTMGWPIAIAPQADAQAGEWAQC